MGLIIIVSGEERLSALDALAAKYPGAEIITQAQAKEYGYDKLATNPIIEDVVPAFAQDPFIITDIPRMAEPIIDLPLHSV
jgi:hypothetical protein